MGDAIGAGIVYHLSKTELAKMDLQGLDIQEENENGTSMQEINKNGLVNKGYEEKSWNKSTNLYYCYKIYHFV